MRASQANIQRPIKEEANGMSANEGSEDIDGQISRRISRSHLNRWDWAFLRRERAAVEPPGVPTDRSVPTQGIAAAAVTRPELSFAAACVADRPTSECEHAEIPSHCPP